MRVPLLLLLLLLLAGCGGHGKRPFVVGAVDDAPKWDAGATAKTTAAGFKADVLSAVWEPGRSFDGRSLARAASALQAAGVEPVLAVYQFSSATPLGAEARRQFTGFAVSLAE